MASWSPTTGAQVRSRSTTPAAGRKPARESPSAPDVLDPGNTPVCFTPDNRRVVVCLPRSGKKGERRSYLFRSYDIARGSPTGPDIDFQPPPAKGWSVYTERVMGNGQWLVVEYSKEWHGVWYAWNLATGKEADQAEPFNRVGFSTDGRFVVTGWSSDGGPALTSPAMVRDVRTGRPVGPGFHALRDFFYLGLSHDGQAVLIEEGSLYGGKRLLVYSASDSRCTLARPMQNATNTLTFSPDGRRVALCDQADGGAGVVEVRDAASGGLIAAPLATPDSSSHLDFSADGRLLAIECRGSVRLLDVKTGLPLGPWLPYQSYRAISGDLPNNDFRIAAADAVL